MKILITGGAGFIGSHLVDKLLLNPDVELLVIDDCSTGKMDNLPRHPRLVTMGASILDDVGYLFENTEVVYHLAALTRPRYSIDYPLETNQVNVAGTLKVLDHCVKNKVQKLIFTSSASIYGDQENFPISESAIPNPKTPYALTKLIGEQYCKLYSDMYGLEVSYIRPFNVYGTRQSIKGGYAAAIPTFIQTLRNGEIPFITGNGKQVRDFVHVDDVTNLMITLLMGDFSDETFNIGSGKSTSINEIYKMVCKIMKKNVKPNYIPPVIDPETQANIDLAKARLNWTPKISLMEGLERTINGL